MTLPDPHEIPLLKVAQFAAHMPEGIGEKAVRAGIASGQIRSISVGRYRLIPTIELYRLADIAPDMSEAGLAGPAIATTSTTQEEVDVQDRTLRSAS